MVVSKRLGHEARSTVLSEATILQHAFLRNVAEGGTGKIYCMRIPRELVPATLAATIQKHQRGDDDMFVDIDTSEGLVW